jgi:6-phosphofructo-2-kinase
VSQYKNIECFFIESICSDEDLLEKNIKLKLQGPDYLGMDPSAAIADFKQRIKNYEKAYQTISEDEEAAGLSYIKLINVGQKMISNRIHGYLPSQAAFYLMQLNINDRNFFS